MSSSFLDDPLGPLAYPLEFQTSLGGKSTSSTMEISHASIGPVYFPIVMYKLKLKGVHPCIFTLKGKVTVCYDLVKDRKNKNDEIDFHSKLLALTPTFMHFLVNSAFSMIFLDVSMFLDHFLVKSGISTIFVHHFLHLS